MSYIIKRTDQGGGVLMNPDHKGKTWTWTPRKARRFATRQQAESECCPENERPVPFESALSYQLVAKISRDWIRRRALIDDSNAMARAEELSASPRPASDARRAWRNMLDWQRREFMVWLAEDETGAFDAAGHLDGTGDRS